MTSIEILRVAAVFGFVGFAFLVAIAAERLRSARRADAALVSKPLANGFERVPRETSVHDEVFCVSCLSATKLPYARPLTLTCPTCSSHALLYRKSIGEEVWADVTGQRKRRRPQLRSV